MATGQALRLLGLSASRQIARSVICRSSCQSRSRSSSCFRPVHVALPVLTGRTLVRRMAHRAWQYLTRPQVYKLAIDMMERYDKVDPDKLDLDSHFIHDLGLDSLDCVEVIMFFEDTFGVEIPDHVGETMFTIRELCEYFLKFYKYDEPLNPYNDP